MAHQTFHTKGIKYQGITRDKLYYALLRHDIPEKCEIDTPRRYLRPAPDLIHQAAVAHNIPINLLYAIMKQESAFDRYAVSRTGARGLLQLQPYTMRAIEKWDYLQPMATSDLFQPAVNIDYAARFIRRLLDRYQQPLLAIAAYNAGPKAIDEWLTTFGDLELAYFIERIPYKETRDYVKYVISNWVAYDVTHTGFPSFELNPKEALPKPRTDIDLTVDLSKTEIEIRVPFRMIQTCDSI